MLQGRNIRKYNYYNDSDEYLLQTGYDTNIRTTILQFISIITI